MPPPPPRLPPYLTPELVEEILLRVPPEDPARLVRVSLACKTWRRLLCDPAFRRRYLAFHRRTPPLLGFLHNRWGRTRGDGDDRSVVPAFFATTTPSPFPQHAFDGCASWCVVDCRHGRVLFEASSDVWLVLVVWDPTTGERKWLPNPPTSCSSYAAAVLCALHGHGCDHLECCSGPFFVVLVESAFGSSVRVHLYSSEAGSWNTTPDLNSGFNVNSNRSTLIGNDIYFVSAFGSRDKILRYNLGNNRVSFLEAPAAHKIPGRFFLVPMEDGLLGLGTILGATRLCLWSRNVDPDVVAGAGWVQCRAIELYKLIPCTYDDLEVVGSADDFGIIFVATVAGVFAIDLKSSRARKVVETMKYCFKIFPFMTFYTPDSRQGIFIVPTEDGLLGVAGIKGSSLYLWLRKVNAEGVEGWMQYRTIELQALFPDDKLTGHPIVTAFAEGVRVIFMDTSRGISIIDLNTEQARMVGEPDIHYPAVPFASFYTPDCACGKLPLPAETD